MITLYCESNRYNEKSIKDWSSDGFSNLNLKHADIRKSIGNKEIWLNDINFNNSNNNLTLNFYVKPTFLNKIDPVKNKVIKSVETITKTGNTTTSKFRPYYIVKVQFTNIKEIKDKWNELNRFKKISIIDDMIDNWYNVKFWSNDLSFLYQGTWKILNELDSSIYPFPSLPDSGKWKKLHGNSGVHLTKHLYFIFKLIPYYVEEIIKYLNGKFVK